MAGGKSKQNPHGGSKHKKFKKNPSSSDRLITRSTNPHDGQYYAVVEKALGCCRFLLKVIESDRRSLRFNGTSCLGMLAGSMQKKSFGNRVNVNDLVLVSFRIQLSGASAEKVDVIGKYSDSDVSRLRSMQEIPTARLLEMMILGKNVNDGNDLFDFQERDEFDTKEDEGVLDEEFKDFFKTTKNSSNNETRSYFDLEQKNNPTTKSFSFGLSNGLLGSMSTKLEKHEEEYDEEQEEEQEEGKDSRTQDQQEFEKEFESI